MPLFGSSVDKTRTMIQDAIKGLGASPDAARAGPDTWLVVKGSAAVLVRLIAQDAKSKFAFVQVASPVMKVPPNAGFYERIAKLNFEMGGLATFGVTPTNEVHLTTARTIEGISPQEIAQLVAQVAHFSDLYDDKLLTEYGRQHAIHAAQKA
jgi:hypothetical protein